MFFAWSRLGQIIGWPETRKVGYLNFRGNFFSERTGETRLVSVSRGRKPEWTGPSRRMNAA